MSASHTPGPWTLGEWKRNIWVGGGPNNDDIAEFNFADEHTVKITREEAIANARLFLAAPDLLAALKDMAALTVRKGIPDRWADALAKADAAIAKATTP